VDFLLVENGGLVLHTQEEQNTNNVCGEEEKKRMRKKKKKTFHCFVRVRKERTIVIQIIR